MLSIIRKLFAESDEDAARREFVERRIAEIVAELEDLPVSDRYVALRSAA
jgi:hypothetical protein